MSPDALRQGNPKPSLPLAACPKTSPAQMSTSSRDGGRFAGTTLAGGVVLVDVGKYRWRDDGDGHMHAAEDGGFAVLNPQAPAAGPELRLVQALPHSLAARLMLLPWPLPASTEEVRVGRCITGRAFCCKVCVRFCIQGRFVFQLSVCVSACMAPCTPCPRTLCWSRWRLASSMRQVGLGVGVGGGVDGLR
jgi:hypothetical protein